MSQPPTSRLRQLVSARRPTPPATGGGRATALLLRLGAVALLGWIGYLHLHLWLQGYRQIPSDGPLFALDAVAGFTLAAALLAWPLPLAGLLAAGYTAATLGALLISLTVGLFGFRESISASFVTPSLATETITLLALLTWTALPATRPRRQPTTGPRPAPAPHNQGMPDHVPLTAPRPRRGERHGRVGGQAGAAPGRPARPAPIRGPDRPWRHTGARSPEGIWT